MRYVLLALVISLAGCTQYKPPSRVDKKFCYLQCVDRILNRYKTPVFDIDGVKKHCTDKTKTYDFCVERQGYIHPYELRNNKLEGE